MRKTILPALLGLFGLLVFTTTVMIAVGMRVPGVLTPITTLVGFVFGVLHASERMGWKKALILLALVFAVALFFESLGVATGLVYGPYHYTEKLGPKFLGLVPYLIATAWFMMMYPALVMAEWLLPRGWMGAKRLLGLAALGGLIMTAWDVVMDPLMVRGGHWIWDAPGAYFGVPLQNYWGWWLTVFTTFVLFQLTTGGAVQKPTAKFDRMALAAYVFIAADNTLTALLTDLAGPALAGIFALTPWIVLAWFKMAEE